MKPFETRDDTSMLTRAAVAAGTALGKVMHKVTGPHKNRIQTYEEHVREDLMPGTNVEVLTKHREDGTNFCGKIIGAAPNAQDTYIVEYHPGLDNGHHSGSELKVIEELPA